MHYLVSFYFLVIVIIVKVVTCVENSTSFLQYKTENLKESYNLEPTIGSLPTGWDDFCMENTENSSTEMMSFKCMIDRNNSGRWNYDEIRDHIASKKVKYKFDIECVQGANISLKWPFKAINLKELKVQNCVLEEFYGDYENEMLATFADELECLRLTDVVAMVSIFDLIYLAGSIVNITQDALCGNDESLIEHTISNLTYNFGASTETFFQNLLNETTGEHDVEKDPVLNDVPKMYNDVLRVEHVCDYKRLRKYEYSINSSPGSFFIDVQTERSKYPVLENLNFSFTPFGEKYPLDNLLKNWVSFYPSLQSMDISHCNIQELNFIGIPDTIKRRDNQTLFVNLTNNVIKELKVSVLETIFDENRMFLNFSQNPLNCSCTEDMKELLSFVQGRDKWTLKRYARYSFIREMRCFFPESLNGTLLKDLTESLLMCKNDFTLTETILVEAVVSLSVFSVLLLVVIIVILVFRREIRILTYTRFHILLPCQPEEVFEEKKFDAFVSYSNKDHEWVNGVFENNTIEGLKDFKFCLHHRDFMAGKTITENIIDSIESSRHTIVIMSRHFLDSSYCLYEFEEAFRQSLSEKKRHLLVILMEEISQNKMPKVLQACLKTFTFIKKDDNIFMDRLIFSLSYKGRDSVGKESKYNAAYENKSCDETKKQESTLTLDKNVYQIGLPQGNVDNEKTEQYNIFP
ncbi:toll-like receptor 2 [Saccostrea echinata]|uniref:toll-like receptor 2 n=1 Tax=Saccostrea echinata TaxID=191078 RepID=UPI002A82704C|nr:toll-like receptor 2 [Saccostrea echinata]